MDKLVALTGETTSTSNSDSTMEVYTDMRKSLQKPSASKLPTPAQIEQFDAVRTEYMIKLDELRNEYQEKFVAILQEGAPNEPAGHAN